MRPGMPADPAADKASKKHLENKVDKLVANEDYRNLAELVIENYESALYLVGHLLSSDEAIKLGASNAIKEIIKVNPLSSLQLQLALDVIQRNEI